MIDEKGRLFGKVNIIDLIVLLVLIAVAVVLALRIGGVTGAEDPNATPTPKPSRSLTPSVIEYTVKCSRMDRVEYERIKAHFDAGDIRFMTNGGLEVEGSEVIGLRAEPCISTVVGEDRKVFAQTDPYYLDVYFTARSATSDDVLNQVNTQQARIGRSFIIKTRSYEVAGLIIACDTVG